MLKQASKNQIKQKSLFFQGGILLPAENPCPPPPPPPQSMQLLKAMEPFSGAQREGNGQNRYMRNHMPCVNEHALSSPSFFNRNTRSSVSPTWLLLSPGTSSWLSWVYPLMPAVEPGRGGVVVVVSGPFPQTGRRSPKSPPPVRVHIIFHLGPPSCRAFAHH